MASKKISARILVALTIGALAYKPNQVVAFPLAQAKALEKEGQVDTSPEAVKYCLGQGATVIDHVSVDEPDPVQTSAQDPVPGSTATPGAADAPS